MSRGRGVRRHRTTRSVSIRRVVRHDLHLRCFGSDGDRYFHVEKLLNRRRRKGSYQYLVKCRGYLEDQSNWEDGRRLVEDCADTVAAFDRSHGAGRR
jgi:hypothetical protein